MYDLLIPLIAILPLAGCGITALIGRRLHKSSGGRATPPDTNSRS